MCRVARQVIGTHFVDIYDGCCARDIQRGRPIHHHAASPDDEDRRDHHHTG